MANNMTGKFLEMNPAVRSAVMGVMALGIAAVTAVSGDREKRESAVDMVLPGDDEEYRDTRSPAFHEANDMLLEGYAELHPIYQELETITRSVDRGELLANIDRIRDLATDIQFRLEEQIDEALAHVAREADENVIDEVLNGSIVHEAEAAARWIESAIVRNDFDDLEAAVIRMNDIFRETDKAFDDRPAFTG